MNKKIIISLTALFVLIILGVFLLFNNSNFIINTASIKFETIDVISKIDGILEELNFENNAEVNKGEILAQIKQDALQQEYEKALQELKEAQNKLKENDTKIKFISSQANNNIRDAKIKLENANNDYVIYKNAFKDGTVTKKDLDKAAKNLQLAKENYENVQKNIELAKESIETNKNLSNSQNEKVENLAKKLEQAELNLSYATFISPVNGTIKEMNVKIKDEIKINQKLMTIVSKDCLIETKLNEKQTNKVKTGQDVIICINPYKHLKGKIENINKNIAIIKLTDDYDFKNNKKVIVKIKIN